MKGNFNEGSCLHSLGSQTGPLIEIPILREIADGLIIQNLTLTIDRMDLAEKYVAEVNKLLEQVRVNCPPENVKANHANEIIEITFTSAIFIERYEKKLLQIFKK